MTPSPDDRFGMPDSAFAAARESHGRDNPVLRMGMYVPTRGEVASLPAAELYSIMVDWMWESPSELIPNNTQIAELRAILLARPDADDLEVQRLIAECDGYLKD
ncbi:MULTISPECIES: hypothetical protein [unclassified Rhodanobacter]|jgi:hypothetical protein|uniref:Uncharacterized protein n=1 Tax=Rhodanobacter humi TaxID=1888173 RepID=A0ABV4AVB7_9GAMM|nr:MAG: hypothetical protein EPN58_17500 [Rhodanobacter sp.]TBR71448.1 MAG: hypothetical protein EPN64_19445 [Burkholderiaceae bacterium]